MRWHPAYIGIGSNLESPRDQVTRAISELHALPDVIMTAASALYRSAPMGPAAQPDFINAVVALVTMLQPQELLGKLREIEDGHGRRRDGERWGPRTLDLDLLVFGRQIITTEELTVPHPGIAERNFVLLPLHDLAPHLDIPGLGAVSLLTRKVAASAEGLEKLG